MNDTHCCLLQPTGAVVGELRFAVAMVDTDIRRMVNNMPVLMDLTQGAITAGAHHKVEHTSDIGELG